MSERGLMLPWLWELWILAFWWSTWSLADTYLLPFHARVGARRADGVRRDARHGHRPQRLAGVEGQRGATRWPT